METTYPLVISSLLQIQYRDLHFCKTSVLVRPSFHQFLSEVTKGPQRSVDASHPISLRPWSGFPGANGRCGTKDSQNRFTENRRQCLKIRTPQNALNFSFFLHRFFPKHPIRVSRLRWSPRMEARATSTETHAQGQWCPCSPRFCWKSLITHR